MIFPEFDPSLLRQQKLCVRFTSENQNALFQFLHNNGCQWGSGDSLLSWSADFYTDEDNRHAIEIRRNLNVSYGSTECFLNAGIDIFDWMPDIQIICPVDDLL